MEPDESSVLAQRAASEGWEGSGQVPLGGRVRKLRAVEDQSAPIPKEITSKIGRRMYVRGSTGSPGKSRMSLFLGLLAAE